MKKLFRFVFRFIIYTIVIIIGMLITFYLLAPVYNFSGPVKFTGEQLYNQYQSIDSLNWKKYNFQVQSNAWLGITDGRKNTNERIDSIYSILGFDHVATSDYQKINHYGNDKPSFIPTYEHGYNIYKTHQVCIGADKVLWVDLMFGQTMSMKQWILDELQKSTRFVVLAHPLLRDGYSIEDMKYLTNYNAIEVLNNMRVSTDHWDAALSSGQLAWIIGNDDAHDVLNSNDVGRRFTMINSESMDSSAILKQLDNGVAYGMDFFRIDDEPMDDKVERSKGIPYLTKAKLRSDTLYVSTDQLPVEIRFIADNGELVKSIKNSKSAWCILDNDYSYLRTEFEFPDGSRMFLNPIVRYSGEKPVSLKNAEVNTSATLTMRMIYFIIGLVIAYGIARWRKNRKTKIS